MDERRVPLRQGDLDAGGDRGPLARSEHHVVGAGEVGPGVPGVGIGGKHPAVGEDDGNGHGLRGGHGRTP